MSEREPTLELAGTWGLSTSDIVSSIDGSRVTAVHWRHQLPELRNTVLPYNMLTYLFSSGRSYRHRGTKVEAVPAARHTMSVVPMGSDGSWTFRDPIDVLHVYIPQALLDDLAASVGRASVQLNDSLSIDDPMLRLMAVEIASTLHEVSLGRLYVDALGTAVAMRLLREHSSASRRTVQSRGGLASWQIKRVCEFLDARLDREVSLMELAGLVNLSSFHFCRAFKESTGASPHEWFVRRRMERAQDIMTAHPTLSLTEVAQCVGYASQSAFGTAFRRVTGTTPSAWRRERLVSPRR